jgi:hypothetical protein
VAVEPAATLAGDDAAAGLEFAVGELSTAAEHPPRTIIIPHEDVVTTRVTHAPDLLIGSAPGRGTGCLFSCGLDDHGLVLVGLFTEHRAERDCVTVGRALAGYRNGISAGFRDGISTEYRRCHLASRWGMACLSGYCGFARHGRLWRAEKRRAEHARAHPVQVLDAGQYLVTACPGNFNDQNGRVGGLSESVRIRARSNGGSLHDNPPGHTAQAGHQPLHGVLLKIFGANFGGRTGRNHPKPRRHGHLLSGVADR